MNIRQGDEYGIAVNIQDSYGDPVTPESVAAIEISIGGITKTYPEEVTYEDGAYVMPLTQQDTFSLDGILHSQVRVKYTNGEVVSASLGYVSVVSSSSKEVL